MPYSAIAWLDGAEISASGWGSGGPLFQPVPPKTNFSFMLRYQLNQLGSKDASESTFKKSNTWGVSNTRLYFLLYFTIMIWQNESIFKLLTTTLYKPEKYTEFMYNFRTRTYTYIYANSLEYCILYVLVSSRMRSSSEANEEIFYSNFFFKLLTVLLNWYKL